MHGTKITIHTLFVTVHVLKNIKNESHDIIYIFKNYFAIVLLVSAIINLIQTDPITLNAV